MMETAIISDAPAFARLAPEWRVLWRVSPNATPFQSPDWLLPWWDAFAPGELQVIAVRRDNELIGVAPLYREAESARVLPVGVALSDYVDVLLHPRFTQEAANAAAQAIASLDGIELVEFPELESGSLALKMNMPNGWNDVVMPASISPVLSLPERVEDLAHSISPSRLRHLRTARRRVARRGESAILEGDPDNAAALFSELVRLHSLKWRAQGETGLFADPRVDLFHEAALPGLMEQGFVRLYALMIDDVTTGVYYGFLSRGRAYAYLCGYHPDYAFESPGAVLLGHAIEEAVRQGAREFHFLRGREAYKYEWGAVDRTNFSRRWLRQAQSSNAA